MPILLASDLTSVESILLNAGIMAVSGVAGWFLKVRSDRSSNRTLFDHRVRLEKEYSLYIELWERLFELRRDVGSLLEVFVNQDDEALLKQAIDRINEFQSVVRRGEPFMHTSVFAPARDVISISRTIILNVQRQERHEGHRVGLAPDDDMRIADKQIALSEDNDAVFERIEKLTQATCNAIRVRVSS